MLLWKCAGVFIEHFLFRAVCQWESPFQPVSHQYQHLLCEIKIPVLLLHLLSYLLLVQVDCYSLLRVLRYTFESLYEDYKTIITFCLQLLPPQAKPPQVDPSKKAFSITVFVGNITDRASDMLIRQLLSVRKDIGLFVLFSLRLFFRNVAQ